MLKILTILILLSFQIYSGEQEIKAYMKQQNSKLDLYKLKKFFVKLFKFLIP